MTISKSLKPNEKKHILKSRFIIAFVVVDFIGTCLNNVFRCIYFKINLKQQVQFKHHPVDS